MAVDANFDRRAFDWATWVHIALWFGPYADRSLASPHPSSSKASDLIRGPLTLKLEMVVSTTFRHMCWNIPWGSGVFA